MPNARAGARSARWPEAGSARRCRRACLHRRPGWRVQRLQPDDENDGPCYTSRVLGVLMYTQLLPHILDTYALDENDTRLTCTAMLRDASCVKPPLHITYQSLTYRVWYT